MTLPFQSAAQRRLLFKTQPKLANKWSKEYGSKIKKAAKRRVKKKKG